MQILLCIRSHFHHAKEQEWKIFSLWSAQDGWKSRNTLQNNRCKLWWNFGSLPSPCPPWSMWWTSWITGSQSVAILCWQTNSLSHWKNFACLPILMVKVKYEIKQICAILYHYVWEFIELFPPPKVRKQHPMIQNKCKILIYLLFSMESKNFFLTCVDTKMLV